MAGSICLPGECGRSTWNGWRHAATLTQSAENEAGQWMVCAWNTQVVVWHQADSISADRIETLLEEAFNERMHLLSFLKLAEPGLFMRVMVIGAQGVFFNGFFLAYLVSPRICHRFVGYLEEEAVITYTRAVEELEAGKLPQWKDLDAPEIAVHYWQMPEGQRKMKDLLLYVRADEAKHREVNHTLGNLNQTFDPNPYQTEYTNPGADHPTKGIDTLRQTGWERNDIFPGAAKE